MASRPNSIGLQGLKPLFFRSLNVAAEQAAEKAPPPFCHSERSEESLFLFLNLNRREIPRFARNDKINYFFRSLSSLSIVGVPQLLGSRNADSLLRQV